MSWEVHAYEVYAFKARVRSLCYYYPIYEPQNILKCTHVSQENLIYLGEHTPNPPTPISILTSVVI